MALKFTLGFLLSRAANLRIADACMLVIHDSSWKFVNFHDPISCSIFIRVYHFAVG